MNNHTKKRASREGKLPEGLKAFRKEQRQAKQPTVSYYPNRGVALNAMTLPPNPTGEGRGIRGKITGWSKASRRRMREFLLTQYIQGDYITVGASFTIPGPIMTTTEAQTLFRMWCMRAKKLQFPSIWRIEIQPRGQLHWHVIVHVPRNSLVWRDGYGDCNGATRPDVDSVSGNRAGTVRGSSEAIEQWQRWAACCKVQRSWHHVLRARGAESFNPPHKQKNGNLITHVSSRMAIPGADRRSTKCESGKEENGKWIRYLQDHSTKAKQEQVAENVGRHWGVIGRKHFDLKPPEVEEVPEHQNPRLVRAVQMWSRPTIRDERCPFGTRKGWKTKRGSRGRSVWFCDPAVLKQLTAWAKTFDPPAPPKMFDPSLFGTRKASA